MKRFTAAAIVTVFVVLTSFANVSADQAAEAQEMLNKAVVMFKEKGKDYTLKRLNSRGPFAKGELYVFALNMDNVLVAHPYNKKIVGKNLHKLKDTKGKLFVQEFKKVAQDPGSGWVEYYWLRHGEKDGTLKRSYIKKVPGEDIYLGAGYYIK
jgi:cytochrome c